MKGKKRQLTSKALTLRLAAVALGMALLVCPLGLYTPFPSQVIDQQETKLGTGPLEVLESQPFDDYRAYLAGNDHCLTLFFCRHTLFGGWDNYGGSVLNLTPEDGPVWASTALYDGNRNIEDGAFYDIHQFGRVAIEGAQSVRILFPSWEGSEPTECSLFQGEDGDRYFWNWHTIQWMDNDHGDFFDIDVEVLDAEGNVLYAYETLPSYTEEELQP